MLIKAGTYRFNDVLSAPSSPNAVIEQTVNFNVDVENVLGDGLEYTAFCTSIHVESAGVSLYVSSVIPENADLSNKQYALYFFEDVGYGVGWLPYYGDKVQTITIPKDTDTTDEFGVWFTANTNPAAASIQYSGATIVSLFPGQTATLKCGGLDMESDVVVEVKEQKEPVMQTLEVNLTEPGIFEFTPDAGYDGIIKVVIGVDAPQLTAPTISIDGDTLTIEATAENTESFAIFVDGIEVATVANE